MKDMMLHAEPTPEKMDCNIFNIFIACLQIKSGYRRKTPGVITILIVRVYYEKSVLCYSV